MKILLLDSEAGPGRDHDRIPVDELAPFGLDCIRSSSGMKHIDLAQYEAIVLHVRDDSHDEAAMTILQAGKPLIVISNAPAWADEVATRLKQMYPQARIQSVAAAQIGRRLRRCFESNSIESLFETPLDLALELLTGLYAVQLQSEVSGESFTLQKLMRSPGDEGRLLTETAQQLLSTIDGFPIKAPTELFKRLLGKSVEDYREELARLRNELFQAIDSP